MKAEPEKKTPDEQSALFSSLVWRLAVETKAFMGEQVHPEVEPMEARPELARQSIDTLEMLRTRTEGNRTTAESEMLEAVLYELRMSFLQSGGQGRVPDKSETRDQKSETGDPDAEPGTPEPGPSTTETQSEGSPGEDADRK